MAMAWQSYGKGRSGFVTGPQSRKLPHMSENPDTKLGVSLAELSACMPSTPRLVSGQPAELAACGPLMKEPLFLERCSTKLARMPVCSAVACESGVHTGRLVANGTHRTRACRLRLSRDEIGYNTATTLTWCAVHDIRRRHHGSPRHLVSQGG